MTQQVFADFLQQSPATLSSIFNGRTKPTLNVIDAIKVKIPDISIEWLLYGTGDMYHTPASPTSEVPQDVVSNPQEQTLNFDLPVSGVSSMSQNPTLTPLFQQGVKSTHPEMLREEIKIVDKQPRKVTEIRVYYDDQTYETFVPSKK